MVAKATFRLEGEDATAAAFRSALGNAQGAANKMQGLFKTAFAGISVAAIASVGARAIEMGDNLNKAAVKAGITGKAMSELAYVARMSDIDLASLSTGIKKMQVSLSEAGTGAKGPTDALTALGLTISDLKDLSADAQFELIGDRISQLKDPADRARAAVDLFGKAGADLLPAFEQGAKGIQAAREEAKRLGLSFSNEQIKALSDADTAIKQLKASWEGFAVSLTATAAPALSEILSLLHGDAKGVFGGGGSKTGTLAEQLKFAQSELDFALKGGYGPRIKEVREEVERLQMVLNGVDDFASRRSHAMAGSGAPQGYNSGAAYWEQMLKDMTELSDVAVSGERIGPQHRMEEYSALLKDAADNNEELLRSIEQINKAGIDMANDQIDAEVKRQEFHDKMVDDWIAREDELQQSSKKTYDTMSVDADEAARNMQSAFADSLFNSFDDGLKGMLRGFLETIRRIAAEAAASHIFDSKSKGGLGLGDLIRAGVGGLFGNSGGGTYDDLYDQYGGGMANGGPLQQGKWYTAGERGPEAIWGGGSGAFATGYGRGGHAITINNNIDARGATQEAIRALPAFIEANNQRLKSDIITGIQRGKYSIGAA